MRAVSAPVPPVLRETDAMIAAMAPDRQPGCYAFRTVPGGAGPIAVPDDAIACFREAEGLSVIAPAPCDAPLAMAWITLRVHSALDGVGLTAAVSGALAGAGIPCNMVAAHHHDHVFVPAAEAGRALAVLRALAGQGGG